MAAFSISVGCAPIRVCYQDVASGMSYLEKASVEGDPSSPCVHSGVIIMSLWKETYL